MTDDPFRSLTAAETIAQGVQATPQWSTGVAQGVTDEDGTTSIIVAGPPDIATDEDSESSDLNPPMSIETLVRPVAKDEPVVVVSVPSGAAYALPYANGLIGVASIPGGETDVTIVSTAATPVTDLRAEAEVLYGGHLIEINVNFYLQSGGLANVLIGRIIREDEDGNTVEVGRFLRSSQLGLNETIQVGVPVHDVDPEPGSYVFYPTIQAGTTGFTIVLNPSTTPETVASLTVTDCGPLPTSAARV